MTGIGNIRSAGSTDPMGQSRSVLEQVLAAPYPYPHETRE